MKNDLPDTYFVAAYCDEIYIGGTALFEHTTYKNKNGEEINIIDPPGPAFQGIAKSLKGFEYKDVKLNSLLIPFILDTLKKMGHSRVYVTPVGNQRNTLQKHYGFIQEPGEINYSLIKYF